MTPVAAKTVAITEFVYDLRRLPHAMFDNVDAVEEFMRMHPVDANSLEPFLFWDRQHYTRNLIDHTEMYDLIAICWEVGQGSSIHNHKGQNCWMSAPIGKLVIQNYKVNEEDVERGYCDIEPIESFEIDSSHPAAVQPHTPVHEVFNPVSFGQRAVSLHLYSRPFDRCTVYSVQNHTCGEIQLHYTSKYGFPQKR